MINIIVAISKNGVIGKDGKLPWSLVEDMKRFKRLTMGGTVIMGANTYKEIGKPLAGRLNVILSSTIKVDEENVVVLPSLKQAIEYSKSAGCDKEIFICGGEGVYKEAIDIADRLYITHIDAQIDGDRFFPPIPDCFYLVKSEGVIDGEFSTTFCEYARKLLQ
ncbi:MAG: dihydrofolate reductase [Clostridia bacterium]|nr:dihydrofolate reductase [Clostridia bacterium]